MLYRGVCLAPLVTWLCIQTCLGKPALIERERRKVQHIEEIKKKILQQLKFESPPDMSRFNMSNIDQTQLRRMKRKLNVRKRKPMKRTYSNIDFNWRHLDANPDISKESKIIKFRLNSWTLPRQRVKSAQITFPISVLERSSDDSYYLFHVLKTGVNNSEKLSLVSHRRRISKAKSITFDVKRILQSHPQKKNFTFLISATYSLNTKDHNISTVPKKTVRMVVRKTRNSQRKKRGIDPSDCVKGDGHVNCCRYKVHISFKDINWDDWVLAPDGYDAYYCAGDCPHRYKMATTFSGIKSLLHLINPSLAPKPHCTATKLSPLTLLHLDEYGSLTYSDYPDMIVDECKCS